MSAVDAYVQELSRRLQGRLPQETLEARLRETRAHLRMSAEEVGEAEAIERFGPARALARAIVRQARGYETEGAASLSLGVGLGVAASVVAAWLFLDHAPIDLGLRASAWLPTLAAAAFAARCLQTRRWLTLPVAAWASAAFALMFVCAGAFPKEVPLEGRAKLYASARRDVAFWKAWERDVAEWRAGRTPARVSLSLVSIKAVGHFPGVPFGVPMPSSVHLDAQRFGNDLADATQNWAAYGEAWAKAVEEGKAAAEARLVLADRGLVDAPIPWTILLLRWVSSSLGFALVLLAYNALGLLLGRIADVLPTRGRRGAA